MAKNEDLVWETLEHAKKIIEWAYDEPWDIKDRFIHDLYIKLNDACIELSERGKENESDSE